MRSLCISTTSRPGVKPASPALAGGLFTAQTSGKPLSLSICSYFQPLPLWPAASLPFPRSPEFPPGSPHLLQKVSFPQAPHPTSICRKLHPAFKAQPKGPRRPHFHPLGKALVYPHPYSQLSPQPLAPQVVSI